MSNLIDWQRDVIYGAVQGDKSNRVETFTVDTCEICGGISEHPSTPLGTLHLDRMVRAPGRLSIGGGRKLTLVTESVRRRELADDLGWCEALGCVTCASCHKEEEEEPEPAQAQADKAAAYDALLPLVQRLLSRVREADKEPRWKYSDTGAEGTSIEVETDALAGVLALTEED